MAAFQSGRGVISKAFQKLKFDISGHHKYGLLHDDLYHDMNEVVKEAVRRLPEDLFYQRQHRHMRALALSTKKMILPPNEWVKYQDDKPYLKPYMDEVMAENKEKEDWNSR